MAIRPILIDSDSPFLGENCAFCKEPFVLEEEIIVCPEDATRHHVPCWIANNNRCTAYGCTGRGQPITRTGSNGAGALEDDEPAVEESAAPVLEGIVEPRRQARRERVETVQRSKVRTMPSSSFGCAQGCLVLAIAVAIVIISVSCFGLWAIADYIMIEVLHWQYREPISLLLNLPTHVAALTSLALLA